LCLLILICFSPYSGRRDLGDSDQSFLISTYALVSTDAPKRKPVSFWKGLWVVMTPAGSPIVMDVLLWGMSVVEEAVLMRRWRGNRNSALSATCFCKLKSLKKVFLKVNKYICKYK
jgi:hypothetical protein